MRTFSTSAGRLSLLFNSLHFFKKHFATILTFGLVAAIGRVIQLGGFGPITAFTNVLLEIIVECARLSLFIYVLGFASIKKGIERLKHLFVDKGQRKKAFRTAIQQFKKQWWAVCINIVGLLLIAFAINYLIDLLAYETCFYLTLKTRGILVPSSSEWTVLLFFKNLTVIPLTLIFDTVLLLWLCNKWSIDNKTSVV
ncbi:MAG TPA: hypothetical protein VL307_02865 [Chitinophagaceae bacterium]|nr:hypothetical protein [Chitinophagaceae bacterium]